MPDEESLRWFNRIEKTQHDVWDEIADLRAHDAEQDQKIAGILGGFAVSRVVTPVIVAIIAIIVGVMAR